MSNANDEVDKHVLHLIYSDLELLEHSINDLAIALHGRSIHTYESDFYKIKSGKLSDCFNRKVRNERNFKYYQLFKGLDLQVDSFIRIIKLHLDRGFCFLSKYSSHVYSTKLFNLCYVDVAYDLYYGVLKQVVTFTLHDCVYLYKFFVKLDNSLLSYRIKHMYIRDEVYDLILHSLWFALKDAWWLYLDNKLLSHLFPFIAHMNVKGDYHVSVQDLNHVLHNIHFVTLISQDLSFQSETQSIVESQSNKDDFDSLCERFESSKVNFNNISESNLEIKYVTSINTLSLKGNENKNATTEFDDNLSLDLDNQNIEYEQFNPSGSLDLGKHLNDLDGNVDSSNTVNWSQVIYVSMVGFVYILLFESYLNVVFKNINTSMEPKLYVEFLSKRLQDLIQVYSLIVEVDINFTAWAHDKLGNWSDEELQKCFNSYSDYLFSDGGYRDNQLFSYRSDSFRNEIRGRIMSQTSEVSMYLLAPTLERLQKTQYLVVSKMASVCSRPVLRSIDKIYLVSESKLYYDVLYNTDKFLIGPKGPLTKSCKILPLPFKRAVFIETFFPIVKAYVSKATHCSYDVCEAIFFDSMSIWDSVIDFFNFSLNPEMIEDECVKLVANALDQIKLAPNVDLDSLERYKASFRQHFFSVPQSSDSMLSLYTYACLYHSGFVPLDTGCSSQCPFNGPANICSSLSRGVHSLYTHEASTPVSNSVLHNPNSQTDINSLSSPNEINSPTNRNQNGPSHHPDATAPTTPNRKLHNEMTDDPATAETPNVAASYGRFGSDMFSGHELTYKLHHLDKYVVWLDGVRKKKMLIFGNLILFFRENSLLQPAGFVTFDSIYSILSPNSLAQVHPNIQILENNSENDSFSCGTSRSSSPPGSLSNGHPNMLENQPSCQSHISLKDLDNNEQSSFIEGVNVAATASVASEEGDANYLNESIDLSGSNSSLSPKYLGAHFKPSFSKKVLHLRNITSNFAQNISLMKPYFSSANAIGNLFKTSLSDSDTQHCTNISRLSGNLDNMLVWGWQIRLELFDSCILDDVGFCNLDIEFTSPEYRKFWEQHIKNKASARSQFTSWPYHSFFFDSI